MKGSNCEDQVPDSGEETECSPSQTSFDDLKGEIACMLSNQDDEIINDGRLISEATNQGISTLNPDMMFEQMVKNYQMAENIYGETLLRLATGYSSEYLEKNIKIPEFQRALKTAMKKKAEELKGKDLLDKDGFTDKGYSVSAATLYIEELDSILPKGLLGERIHKKESATGEHTTDSVIAPALRYRDISVRRTIKTAVRRKHGKIIAEDLRSHEKKAKGSAYIVYAIDSSGSMKGKKVETAKKAGIALAYKAILNRDKVGLMVFNTEVKEEIMPSLDFVNLLRHIAKIRAGAQTDIAETLQRAVQLFPKQNITKHLVLLTDAVPTISNDALEDDPFKAALKAASTARSAGITISVIGISLDKEGEKLGEQIVAVGGGKLYSAKHLEDVDKLVLEDYRRMVEER